MADEKETKKEEMKDLEPKNDPKGGINVPQSFVDVTRGPRRRGPDDVGEPE